jgi:hypothetical protein
MAIPLFDFVTSDNPPDLSLLRQAIVSGAAGPSFVGRRRDLREHLAELEREFAGAPFLDLYHAALVVVIRRRLRVETAYRDFRSLWNVCRQDLLGRLTARWLISACDTIMDHDDDPFERAIACCAVNFLNTIKLYETERLTNSEPRYALSEITSAVPLFDGMTAFLVGKGNMISNLRKRTETICAIKPNALASDLMREIFRRADRADTVYRRLAAEHKIDATRWTQEGQ